MTVGNDQAAGQDLDEGIISRIATLTNGNEYAFSFYRAFGTYLPSWLSYENDIVLKVVLLHCEDIPYSTGDPDSYVVPDYTAFQHQVIYCETLTGQTPLDYWNHIAFKFTPEDDYDVVWIFAERTNPQPDTYRDIFIAYPEIIDVPQVAQLQHERNGCYEIVSAPDMPCTFNELAGIYYTDPYLPYAITVTSWPLYLNLSKPGTYNFYYGLTADWFDNNGCSENIDKLQIATITIGCDTCHCGDSTWFDCSDSIEYVCNMVPNPDFDIINPNDLLNAFNLGNVYEWGYTSENTADINSGGVNVTPPALPAELVGKNYASMLAIHSQYTPGSPYGESIVAQIGKVKKGKEYAFSFWLAGTYSPASANFYGGYSSFTFKAILTECQNFPNEPNYPLVLAKKQEIVCETYMNYKGDPWQQYFVSFVADDDYEMLVLYNDIDPNSNLGWAYLHFAYPELIDVAQSYANWPAPTPIARCEVMIGPDDVCGVLNAEYTWTDPNSNIVYQGPAYQQLQVNLANAGLYTLSMTVPTAATGNNTCSNNNAVITGTVNVPSSCECGIMRIDSASVEKLYHDDGVIVPNQNGLHYVNLLDNIDANCQTSICHFIDEGHLFFYFKSNYTSGNVWSIFRDGIPVGDPASYTNWYTPSPPVNTNHVYEPHLTFINFYGPTTFEIRLNNGSEQKSVYVTMYPQVFMSSATAGCQYNAVTGMMEIYITNNTYVTPSTQWTWDMSNNPSFVYTQPSINSPFIYFDPTQAALTGGGFDATITTSNSLYGCERRRHFWISGNIYQCQGPYWRSQNTATAESEAALKIYPNPVNSSFSLGSPKEIKEVMLYSITGKLVKRFSDADISYSEFNIEELQTGSYCVMVNYADGTRETKVIVKQ
jgi:hypothetical protein